ncbi:porin [Pandoraea anhela]|uniref:Outer membrane porin protein n=1 Tax=Pandoraea anhela TaxID=2508295 RepID=A0A5E4YRB0_9BURK|nr:porin [Pandoraea anhela]VVE51414.1 Outer membrane porin protein [Pandoraea anhela]
MNKVPRLCAFALGVACASTSYAQSNVTLYGLIDTGITWSSNQYGSSNWEVTSGKLSGARWGIRFTEDIGDGWRALGVLENGFNSANGAALQNGRMFGRQAYIGVLNNTYGTLLFGRQYTPLALYGGFLTSALRWGTSLMAHPLDLDLLAGTTRFNNAIDYESPNFGGFTYKLQYAFSNQASGSAGTGFSNNREWGSAIRYVSNDLTISAGYAQISRPDSASNANGAVVGDYQTALPLWVRQVDSTLSGTSPSAAALVVGIQKTGMIAMLYTLDRWSVGAVVSRTLLSDDVMTHASTTNMNGNGSLSLDVAELNLTYQITPANYTGLMVTYSSGQFQSGATHTSPHWWQIGIANDYFLSKRTDVYVAAAYEIGGARDAIAQITLNAPSSSRTEAGVSVGMRHRF